MPEQITKYPDVTLQVLKGAGAVCGEGAPQKILTHCPKERFCSLPSGKLCIYGLRDIPQMTQIQLPELAAVVASVPHGQGHWALEGMPLGAALVAAFVAGIALGRWWRRSRNGA